MIIKLIITTQSETSLLQAVEAAQHHLDAVVDLYTATAYIRASEDCTPFDLQGAMKNIEGVRVEIEGELER